MKRNTAARNAWTSRLSDVVLTGSQVSPSAKIDAMTSASDFQCYTGFSCPQMGIESQPQRLWLREDRRWELLEKVSLPGPSPLTVNQTKRVSPGHEESLTRYQPTFDSSATGLVPDTAIGTPPAWTVAATDGWTCVPYHFSQRGPRLSQLRSADSCSGRWPCCHHTHRDVPEMILKQSTMEV